MSTGYASTPGEDHADVAVLGCGLVGLACARAIARTDRRVVLVGERIPGEASPAAAGILCPSLERTHRESHRFALAARDCYPDFVDELLEETGVNIALNRLGILEVAVADTEAEGLAAAATGPAKWLDMSTLVALEPALTHGAGRGALLHPDDGAVDNISLLHALRVAVEGTRTVRMLDSRARRLELGNASIRVVTSDGRRVVAEQVVVALGAWAPLLQGLPSPLPITPVRGQIVTLVGAPLRHVCFGAHQYIVPRPGAQTLIGSTMEVVGYRIGSAEAAVRSMRASASRTCPVLGDAREAARWSGLRPVTPDLVPILGPDPEDPRVLYACGHSRNGVLLAPLTAEVIAAQVDNREGPTSVQALGIDRFRHT